jgi:hypothetical protein
LECKKFDSDKVANVGNLNDQIVSFGRCNRKEHLPQIVIKTFLDFDFGSNFNIYIFSPTRGLIGSSCPSVCLSFPTLVKLNRF